MRSTAILGRRSSGGSEGSMANGSIDLPRIQVGQELDRLRALQRFRQKTGNLLHGAAHAALQPGPLLRAYDHVEQWPSGLEVHPAIMAKHKEFEPRDLAFLELPETSSIQRGLLKSRTRGGSSRDPQLSCSAISTPTLGSTPPL